MTDSSLAPIESFQNGFQELVAASNVSEVKRVRDKAEAVRKYVQNAKLGLGLQNQAAELKIRAERKAGKLLAKMKLRGGDRAKSQSATLKKLGIDKHQSSRWQQIAAVPESKFEEWVGQSREQQSELTTASLLRLAKGIKKRRPNGKAPKARSPKSDLQHNIAELINHTETLEHLVKSQGSAVDDRKKAVELRIINRLVTECRKLAKGIDASVTKLKYQLSEDD